MVVTGGTVLAFGASSMAEEFSENSTQCAVLYNLDSAIEAGTTFQVLDANGEEILSYTPTNSYSSVSFSSPDLTLGETYTLVSGETSTEIMLESVSTTNGSSAGGMGGGKGGPPSSGSQGGASASAATSPSSAVSLGELDRSVWILLGDSVLLLVAGILFAKKYRR